MAWNDPNWGKKGNDSGPPDLDELWRRFNQKLSGLFGGKGRGAPPAGPSGGKGANPTSGAILLLSIIAIIWIGSGFYIVSEGKRGVVLRFGKLAETVTKSGPHWHLPYPIETVEIVDIAQNRLTEVGFRQNERNIQANEAAMLTSDKNIINVLFTVQYTITDPKAYLFNNKVGDDQVFVRQIAESAMREVVGKSKVDDVFGDSITVANKAGLLMQGMLDRYQVGITVAGINIRPVQAPEQVQAAFNDAIKADQDRVRQKNEGEAYFNDIVPKAKGGAARLLQEAEGYKQSTIARAEGDASRFKQLVAEYNKAPGVTRDRLYLDAMQQIFSNTTKILVDQKSGGNMLYLPLDKLMQKMNEGPAATPPKPPTGDTPRASEYEQGRDLLRNRESRP